MSGRIADEAHSSGPTGDDEAVADLLLEVIRHARGAARRRKVVEAFAACRRRWTREGRCQGAAETRDLIVDWLNGEVLAARARGSTSQAALHHAGFADAMFKASIAVESEGFRAPAAENLAARMSDDELLRAIQSADLPDDTIELLRAERRFRHDCRGSC